MACLPYNLNKMQFAAQNNIINRRRLPPNPYTQQKTNPAAAEAAQEAAIRQAAEAAAVHGNIQQELYPSVAMGSVRAEACCDNRTGCNIFNAALRDPFWPSFAHPRWLSCSALHSGQSTR